MKRHSKRPLAPGLVVFLVLYAPVVFQDPSWTARGDVLKTYDGRVFEGKILEENDTHVRIDTMVGQIRIQVGVPRHQVSSVDKGPIPDDFFKPEEKAAPRVSDPAKFKPGTALYIEVPIVGRFGVQVVPKGLARSLAYAVRNKIEHVVFFVDSQGGDQIVAGEVYDLLAKYDDKIKYYALVRDSIGVAMAVTVWCDKVFLLPGANLGGTVLVVDKDRHPGDPEVVVSQIAYEVGEEAAKHGWSAPVVRAMIDPGEALVAWVDDGGRAASGVRPPSSVAREKIVATCRPGSLLTLTRDQAVKLGLAHKYQGSASGLGYELGLDPWTEESDYGKTAMTTAAKTHRQEMERSAEKARRSIEKLVKRRNSTQRYVDRYLALAHNFDPELSAQSSYEKFSSSWDRYWGGGPIAGTVTRRKWRDLTDATLQALARAKKGVVELQRLDREAKSLGIDPSHAPGELEKLLDDIGLKMNLLVFWRNRKTSAT